MDVLILELEPVKLESSNDTSPLPSLLGRDILNKWDMRLSSRTNELTIEVKEADGFLEENGFKIQGFPNNCRIKSGSTKAALIYREEAPARQSG